MKQLIFKFLLFLCMMMAKLSYAGEHTCPEKLQQSQYFKTTETILAMSCKILPNKPEKMVVSYILQPAYLQNNHLTTEHTQMQDYIWVTLLLDSSDYKLLNKVQQTIVNDASVNINEHSIWIDTTAYQLRPELRAFAVRLQIGHSPSCADGGTSDYLTMFVEEHHQLRPILKFLPMSYWYIRENNHCYLPSKTGARPMVIERMKLYLKIEPTITNGFNDVTIVGISRQENEKNEQIGKRTIRQTLSYGGQTYSIKPWEAVLDKKWYGLANKF